MALEGPQASRARVFQEEIFGPVLVVVPFEDEAEGIALANATVYGLTAGVFTRSPARARRVAEALRAGNVYVNRETHRGPGGDRALRGRLALRHRPQGRGPGVPLRLRHPQGPRGPATTPALPPAVVRSGPPRPSEAPEGIRRATGGQPG